MSLSEREVDLEITEGVPQKFRATTGADEEGYTTRPAEAIGGVSPKVVEASPSSGGGGSSTGSGCSGGSNCDEPVQ